MSAVVTILATLVSSHAFAGNVMHMTCRRTTSNNRPLASVYMHIDLTSETTGVARIQVLQHSDEVLKAKDIPVNISKVNGITRITDNQGLIDLSSGHHLDVPVFVKDQNGNLVFSESSEYCYTGGLL